MGKNTASVARIAAFVAVPVVIVLVAALFTSRSTIAAVSNPEPEDLMEEIAAISSANKASPASTAAVSAAAAAIAKAATLNPEDVKDDYFVDEDTTEREHLETLPPTHVSSAVRLVRSKSLLRWARAHGASFNAELGVDEHGGLGLYSTRELPPRPILSLTKREFEDTCVASVPPLLAIAHDNVLVDFVNKLLPEDKSAAQTLFVVLCALRGAECFHFPWIRSLPSAEAALTLVSNATLEAVARESLTMVTLRKLRDQQRARQARAVEAILRHAKRHLSPAHPVNKFAHRLVWSPEDDLAEEQHQQEEVSSKGKGKSERGDGGDAVAAAAAAAADTSNSGRRPRDRAFAAEAAEYERQRGAAAARATTPQLQQQVPPAFPSRLWFWAHHIVTSREFAAGLVPALDLANHQSARVLRNGTQLEESPMVMAPPRPPHRLFLVCPATGAAQGEEVFVTYTMGADNTFDSVSWFANYGFIPPSGKRDILFQLSLTHDGVIKHSLPSAASSKKNGGGGGGTFISPKPVKAEGFTRMQDYFAKRVRIVGDAPERFRAHVAAALKSASSGDDDDYDDPHKLRAIAPAVLQLLEEERSLVKAILAQPDHALEPLNAQLSEA